MPTNKETKEKTVTINCPPAWPQTSPAQSKMTNLQSSGTVPVILFTYFVQVFFLYMNEERWSDADKFRWKIKQFGCTDGRGEGGGSSFFFLFYLRREARHPCFRCFTRQSEVQTHLAKEALVTSRRPFQRNPTEWTQTTTCSLWEHQEQPNWSFPALWRDASSPTRVTTSVNEGFLTVEKHGEVPGTSSWTDYYTTTYWRAEGRVIGCANEKCKAGIQNESNGGEVTYKKQKKEKGPKQRQVPA